MGGLSLLTGILGISQLLLIFEPVPSARRETVLVPSAVSVVPSISASEGTTFLQTFLVQLSSNSDLDSGS